MKEYNEEETLDSLLDALVTYSKFYNKAYSKESLVQIGRASCRERVSSPV